MTDAIIIEEYDPGWPRSFEAIRARIASMIGRFAAGVEHVGSTAVPRLAAKPIIDIDVLLNSSEDLTKVIKELTHLGYAHQGTLGIRGRDAFKAPAHDLPHHLYVCSPNCQEFVRHLAFRDYLRSHPGEAEEYARLKRYLSGRFSIDRDAYAEAKGEFIERVLRRARRETPELFSRVFRISD